MTDTQKILVRTILAKTWEHGASRGATFAELEKVSGLTREQIYDDNTESGELAEYGQSGNGFLDIGKVSVAPSSPDFVDLLENWSR